jgi:hypothetical protein
LQNVPATSENTICTTCSVFSGPECSILRSHVTPWSHTSPTVGIENSL